MEFCAATGATDTAILLEGEVETAVGGSLGLFVWVFGKKLFPNRKRLTHIRQIRI